MYTNLKTFLLFIATKQCIPETSQVHHAVVSNHEKYSLILRFLLSSFPVPQVHYSLYGDEGHLWVSLYRKKKRGGDAAQGGGFLGSP